jgi:hypothetical protein
VASAQNFMAAERKLVRNSVRNRNFRIVLRIAVVDAISRRGKIGAAVCCIVVQAAFVQEYFLPKQHNLMLVKLTVAKCARNRSSILFAFVRLIAVRSAWKWVCLKGFPNVGTASIAPSMHARILLAQTLEFFSVPFVAITSVLRVVYKGQKKPPRIRIFA